MRGAWKVRSILSGVALLQGCTAVNSDPVVYNEQLATILRGIHVASHQSEDLGVPAGYYQVREFRVWGEPDQRAIVLCFLEAYGTNVDPTLSILPRSGEEFVFTEFSKDVHQMGVYEVSVEDAYGHSLQIDMTYQSECWEVVCSLDEVPTRLTTQSYTTGELNTCGVVEDPPFTVPDQ